MAGPTEVLQIMTPEEWGKPTEVEEKWIPFVDENVQAKFPPGTEMESIRPHGASYWTRTAHILTRMADSTLRSYFLKVSQGNRGKTMVLGEFVSMQTLYQVSPKFVPKTIRYVTYASDSDIHFLCCELINMTSEIPEIEAFTSTLAEFHAKKSTFVIIHVFY